MIIQEVLQQLENSTTPVVKILKRSEHFKVLVLGLKKGMILKEHQTSTTTKLVIVDGSIIYRKADDSINMNKFDEIDIPVNVPHSVEAQEDSICFLIQG